MAKSFLTILAAGLFTLPLSAEEHSPELARKTFLAVWQKVDESFYDRTFNGVDWKKIKEQYEGKVKEAGSREELRTILNEMLGELGRSHFGVFGSGEENDDQDENGAYLGLELRFSKGKLLVFEVAPDSPAAKAGVTPGMEIVKIEKKGVPKFLKSHSIKPDSKGVVLHHAMGEVYELAATPKDGKTTLRIKGRKKPFNFRPGFYEGEWGSLGQGQEHPVEFNTSLVPGEEKVRLIDFNIFVPSIMPRLIKAVAQANSENADGMIIDLRGNPGGLAIMATGLIGRLIDEELDLGDMNNPSGNYPFHAFPQENAYLGPIAVLVDSFSASTSEIFAAALQEHKRARIIGRPTMAAVLPSILDNLPNGDRLQYAIGDFVTAVDKVHLEGQGVTPDDLIPLDPAVLQQGKDPDLEAALRWIKKQKTKKKQ